MNRSIKARLEKLESRKAAESKQSDAIDNTKAWLARILAELEAAKKPM